MLKDAGPEKACDYYEEKKLIEKELGRQQENGKAIKNINDNFNKKLQNLKNMRTAMNRPGFKFD